MSDKPFLILLPGIMSDEAFWANQIAGLSDICTPIAGDLTRGKTIAEMAQNILEAAPERFALAGLSLGGYVAFEMMRAAPERITRLALLDTHAQQEPLVTSPRRVEMEAMARDGRYSEIMPSMIGRILHKPFHGTAIAQEMIQMAERVGAAVFLAHLEAIRGRIDSRPHLQAIAVPTAVICGEHDEITPRDLHREMAESIPDATLHIIPGAGHLPPVEQPVAVNAVFRAWLSR